MKKILTVISALILSVCIAPAYAEEVKLMLGQWSYHQNKPSGGFDTEYNTNHDLLGLRVGDYSFFRYNNSKYKESYAILKDVYKKDIAGFTIGASAGIVSNYSQDGLPTASALLMIRKQIGNVGIEFNTVPNFVYTLGFTYKLDKEISLKSKHNSDWALSYGQGYGGANAAITYNLNDSFNVRLFGTSKTSNWYDYWNDEEGSDVRLIQHEVLKARTFGLVLDYAPFKGDFQVFAGVAHNASYYKTKFTVGALQANSGAVRLNHRDVHVTAGDTVDGYATADKVAATAGVRWGNPFTHESPWSWWVEASVVSLSGLDAQATYTATEGSEAPVEVIQDALEVWEDYEEDKYGSKYNVIPNVSLGITLRF